jgi:hypothetical protein
MTSVFQVALFTSSIHVAMASVGPIMTEALEAEGLNIDIVPMHPKMAGLS